MTGVTLITPTSDRPIAFSLCEYWMHRQTYDGNLQWIVADDGTTPVECRLGQTHIRRAPASDPVSSFCGNLIAALKQADNDYVMFIEDDDWYRSDYIAKQVERLGRGGLLAGEGRARYYNLQTGSWHIHDRRRQPRHSSLCQTAMKSECIPRLISQLKRKPTKFIDKALWSWHASENNRLEPESASCIGIKGVPGKNNLALGDARASTRCRNGDPHGSVLRKWIGDNDAGVYFRLVSDYNSQVLPEYWRKELPTDTSIPNPLNRTSFLNSIIQNMKYRSYLEVGHQKDGNFAKIEISHKVGVNPEAGGTLRMHSDDFFRVNREKFDLIFIDGLHLQEQVLKDVSHALEVLSSEGTIVLHDCLPQQVSHQLRARPKVRSAWTGDVWKAVVELRTRPDIDIAVIDRDWGLGVVRKRLNTALLENRPHTLSWEIYRDNRDYLLRVLPERQFHTWMYSPRWNVVNGKNSPATPRKHVPVTN